ncbi:DUF6287 domain-containing protein [Enterococcus faecalis]|uniref:DUF6287 domain-containing protein n=1 Tax=Enterococcus faecalis TaxID=1351 RepID=UPI000DEA2F59|nr:DUF6287 domain-containing protein [Enterococcus faecalis]EGO8274267.1 hypothetical protein [Enterococcus faecalis]EGO9002270.1 hypothetical protein [Enterococcus faecalis]MDB1622500.1 DUF6287 domain-containing protein [Enterococcus faecalis]NSW10257.1 hypothetical protein [Enterococcus faecalis]RBR47060.1 hypothetical protein EB28_01271 [Enterococcus faecalis]
MKKGRLAILVGVAVLSLAACREPKEKKVTAPTEASSKVEETNEKTSETIDKTNKQVSSSVESNESVKSEEPTADENNSQLTVADLDTTAINTSDFTTLAGTWKNGKGESLIIHPDGSTNTGGMITKDSPTDESRPITSLSIRWGPTGAALLLYKIGVENPNGDQSDKTEPRLLITQDSGNYPAEEYYYRSSEEGIQDQNEDTKIIDTQEKAEACIRKTLTDAENNDTNLGFLGMNGNDFFFRAQSKQMVANGGTGTVGFYRVSPQGAVRITDAQGN